MDFVNLSVLIVSYNTRELTLECLRSVYEQTKGVAFEVIVVENGSTDGSKEAVAREFPGVKLVVSGTNLGFAGANNVAAKDANGRYLLLLNPDTVVLEGAVQKLVEFMEAHPEAGIVGGRTLYGNRTLNRTSCWKKPTLWSSFCQGLGLSALFSGWAFFNPEAMPRWPRDTVREVDVVTGCLLLIRRELWEQLGGFDLAFFMYGEDADLCLRAKRLGSKCMICPEATIVHYGGASEKVRAEKMVRLFKAKTQIYAKHWSRRAAVLGVSALDLWVFTRMIWYGTAGMVWSSSKATGDVWRSIWPRRGEWRAMLRTGAVPRDEFKTPTIGAAVALGLLDGDLAGGHSIRKRQQRLLAQRCSQRRMLVLSYDDGPGPNLTPEVLALLDAWEVKASFFLIGRRVEGHEELVDRVVQSGHELGCHGFAHVNAWKTWPTRTLEDVRHGYRALEKWIEPDAPFRPACGKLSLAVWRELRQRKSPIAWWTIDSGDTHPHLPAPQAIVDGVARAGGGVVLMHDCDRKSHQEPKARAAFVLRTTELLLQTAKREGMNVCRYSDLWKAPALERAQAVAR